MEKQDTYLARYVVHDVNIFCFSFANMATKNPRDEKLIIRFGENVRKHRISRGLTILQLATMCNVELGAISTIERGKVNCTISTANYIANALEISIEQLFK